MRENDVVFFNLHRRYVNTKNDYGGFLGIFLLLFSAVSVILSIVFFVREKKKIYLSYIFVFVFFIVFSILVIFLTTSFEFISSGMKF